MHRLPWNEWPCLYFGLFKISLLMALKLITANPENVKTFVSLIYTKITIPYSYFISFGKMVCDVFWTGPENNSWTIMHNFIGYVLTCDWLIFLNWLKILSGWPWYVCSHCKWTSSEKHYCEKLGVTVPFEWSWSGSVIQDHSDHSTSICPRQRFISSLMCHDLSELRSLILT